jgi:hypothetical protein
MRTLIVMRFHRASRELIQLAMLALLFSLLPILFALFKDEFRWWALTWTQFRAPFLSALGCALFFIGLLFQYPAWAKRWLVGCSVVWFIFCFLEVQKTPFASLIIFFILSHSALWMIYRWTTQFLSMPHVHLGVDWFYGPSPFGPNLKAELIQDGVSTRLLVSRISLEGLSVYSTDPNWDVPEKHDSELLISFRDRSVKIPGEILTAYSDKKGLKATLIGLKFKLLNPDQEKDLSDFLERLRGEGHEF